MTTSTASSRSAQRVRRASHPPAGRGRVVARLVAVGLWSAACGVLHGAGAVGLRPFPRSRRRWGRGCVRAWGRGIATVLGMRITVRGRPPSPPYLLVSNHLSYLDIIAYAAVTGATFVARHDLRYWPGLGTLARIGGTVFIDRARKRHTIPVMTQIQERLDGGHGMVIFAEGTSSRGDRVYPLKASLLELPARTERPVHYAAISYHTPAGNPAAGRAVCWWGDMPFGPHLIGVCRLPHFDATIRFGESPIRDGDRKFLADRLYGEIVRLFTPVAMDDDDQNAD